MCLILLMFKVDNSFHVFKEVGPAYDEENCSSKGPTRIQAYPGPICEPMASFDLQVVLSIEHEVIQSEYKFS